jgi:hypothetical protein
MSPLEQRANIKFCALLKKTPSETLRVLEKAYSKAAGMKRQVYEWQECFRYGCASVDDNPHCSQLQQMTKKKLSMHTLLCKVTHERVWRRYEWK